MQGMLSNWRICFNVFNQRTYDEFLCNLSKIYLIVHTTTCSNFPKWYQQTTKATLKCNTESFWPVCKLWIVTHKCIHDSKPQGCDQQHKLLKVTWNATNRCKHKNQASKQSFANNLFKISCKYTQGMLSNWKLWFNGFNIRIYDEILCSLGKLMKLFRTQAVLTSQFDVSKLQKQVRSVIRNHLDQCANFSLFPINVCVTVSHYVLFNSINR